MELKLVAKLQQSLVMTPQLKMAIKLLTLNHLELKDAVAQELIENPVLDEINDDAPRTMESEPANLPTAADDRPRELTLGDATTPSPAEVKSDIDWEAYAESYNYLPPSAGTGKDSSFDDLPGIDQTLTRGETLEEHIL
jgi:RNA polymerase sigma-54 factor